MRIRQTAKSFLPNHVNIAHNSGIVLELDGVQHLNLTRYKYMKVKTRRARQQRILQAYDGIYLVPVGLKAIEKAAVISFIASKARYVHRN